MSDWLPVNQAVGEEIPAGAKATFTFEPDAGKMRVGSIGVSKHIGLTYTVKVDGEERFGPAPIPPTDIDNSAQTHEPRLPVDRTLSVIVKNPSSVNRFVAAQLRGIEQ